MAMRIKNHWRALISTLLLPLISFGQIKDEPYPQASSVKFDISSELKSAKLLKLEVDYNNNVYVLTDKGLYRDFYGSKISKDLLYRKLSSMNPIDITTQAGSGYLYYLYADRFLTNAHAGTIFAKIPENSYQTILVNQSGLVLLAGVGKAALYKISEKVCDLKLPEDQPTRWYVDKDNFYALSTNSIKILVQNEWKTIYRGENITCMAFSANQYIVGTKDGYLVLNSSTGKIEQSIKKELPVSSIKDLLVVNSQTWFSTSDGAFREEAGNIVTFRENAGW
jgi:ligand-binding sensor domain-containing protein